MNNFVIYPCTHRIFCLAVNIFFKKLKHEEEQQEDDDNNKNNMNNNNNNNSVHLLILFTYPFLILRSL